MKPVHFPHTTRRPESGAAGVLLLLLTALFSLRPHSAAAAANAPGKGLGPLSFSAVNPEANPAAADAGPLELSAEQCQRIDLLYNRINAIDAFTFAKIASTGASIVWSAAISSFVVAIAYLTLLGFAIAGLVAVAVLLR